METFSLWPYHRWYVHKLWFTNIGLSSGKPISFMSNFLNSFFVLSTFWQSFQRENFTIILPFFLLIRWQASILFPSIGQPTFSNIFKTFCSKSPSLTLQGTPTSSKHSRLEYWAFAQHWCSMETSLSGSTECTYLATVSSDWSFSKFSLNLHIWSIILLLAASISVCWDSNIEIRSFFSSLSKDSSVYFDIIGIFIS